MCEKQRCVYFVLGFRLHLWPLSVLSVSTFEAEVEKFRLKYSPVHTQISTTHKQTHTHTQTDNTYDKGYGCERRITGLIMEPSFSWAKDCPRGGTRVQSCPHTAKMEEEVIVWGHRGEWLRMWRPVSVICPLLGLRLGLWGGGWWIWCWWHKHKWYLT